MDTFKLVIVVAIWSLALMMILIRPESGWAIRRWLRSRLSKERWASV